MNYKECLDYIHSLLRFGSKPGLSRISYLLDRLGNPQKKLRIIHIAGTNGKGSTAVMVQSICSAAGYKTGLYISPFVTDFCERIQVDGNYINENELCEITQKIREAAQTLNNTDPVTEFEFITALAFECFVQKKCDVVVLETGLGGRFDATNVVEKPLVSVITRIGLDHQNVLGDSIEKIAFEKSGIIKSRCPVVVSSHQPECALEVIRAECKNKKSPLFLNCLPSFSSCTVGVSGNEFVFDSSVYKSGLIGTHQFDNAANAITAVEVSGLKIKQSDIVEGLSKAFLPARSEILSTEPIVILDGSHNIDGIASLSDLLRQLNINKITAIIGMMADKSISDALRQISPLCKDIVTVTVEDNPRSACATQLASICSEFNDNVHIATDYDNAIKTAIQLANGGPIVVFGSLYLSGGIRQSLINTFKC
ncbi:MAG: folylpolyglutamate synthase/dihydrofolate synthase family protein [bacterium]|nr:folylpolyglutamate synthase/dihydrofolate synthase family protein [bacterium]